MQPNPNRSRALIAVTGPDAVHFLQGLLTQDVSKLAADRIQFAALLSPQGKILHDMFLLPIEHGVLLDTPAVYKETLLKRLALYKLRAQVAITDVSDQWQLRYSAQEGCPDPRHAALPKRVYINGAAEAPGAVAYAPTCLSLGIPDSTVDFAPDEIVALDAGYDLLHAVSFTKGCYVGQEVTARMHYKNIARRGFFILEQDGVPVRLALLKFEEVEVANHRVTLDGREYTARLPDWMQPKWEQFKTIG